MVLQNWVGGQTFFYFTLKKLLSYHTRAVHTNIHADKKVVGGIDIYILFLETGITNFRSDNWKHRVYFDLI